MLEKYAEYLKNENKAANTIKSYVQHVGQYLKWYDETYGEEFKQLYRANILDFVSYLRNIKKLDTRSVNAKLSSLISFNTFMIDEGSPGQLCSIQKGYEQNPG